MKNKKITIYELMRLIKDGKAPYEVIYQGTKYYIDELENYYRAEDRTPLFERIFNNYNDYDALQEKVEILPEENDGWEDIEQCSKKDFLDLSLDERTIELYYYVRDLIKNQKYLKERLDKNDCVFEQEKVSFKQYINEKLESKDE